MPDRDQYCAGCMTKLTAGRCTQCSWSDAQQGESHSHLPLHYILLDRYYIGRTLGEGGFGVTYLARDLRLDRVVAVKEYLPMTHCSRLTDRVTVRPHSNEKDGHYQHGMEGFLNEAKALARLDGHPNIVSITDYAQANGTAYLAMAYIDGVTLTRHLASQGGRLPYQTAIDIMLHVMSAIREMHSYGLLHRDISPANIMITRQGQVKVVDFGAARYAVGDRELSMILKPGYAPEEQFRTQGKQGTWTDVYATGATLYHCITGIRPSSAPDRIAEDDLVKPSVLRPEVPASIDEAIMKAMAVKAADRFQTIDQFQNALLVKEPAEAKKKTDPPITPPVVTTTDTPKPPIVTPPKSQVSQSGQTQGAASGAWKPIIAVAAIVLLAIAGFFIVQRIWPSRSDSSKETPVPAASSPQPDTKPTAASVPDANPPAAEPGPSDGSPSAAGSTQYATPSPGFADNKTKSSQNKKNAVDHPKRPNAEDCCSDPKDALACNKARKAEGLAPCFINNN